MRGFKRIIFHLFFCHVSSVYRLLSEFGAVFVDVERLDVTCHAKPAASVCLLAWQSCFQLSSVNRRPLAFTVLCAL